MDFLSGLYENIISFLGFGALILCIVFAVRFIKTREKFLLVLILLFGIASYQMIPAFTAGKSISRDKQANVQENLGKEAPSQAFSPDDAEKYLECGYKYTLRYNGRRAIECYEKAYELTGAYAPRWGLYASAVYDAKGDLNKSRNILKELEVWDALSMSYYFSDEYDSALYYAKKQIASRPNRYSGYLNCAIVYRSMNKMDLAEQYYNKALNVAKNASPSSVEWVVDRYKNFDKLKQNHINYNKKFKF